MPTYSSPPITIDGVVFRLKDGKLEVLLIKRSREPFKGMWALPGTYVSREETTTEALHRALTAKAGIRTDDLIYSEQLYTFDTPAVRYPDGYAVSIVYYALYRSGAPDPQATSENPSFVPVEVLPALAYQHADSVHYAIERLRGKILYTNVIFALLPPQFTFRQLQLAYEAILGTQLDKRNFRKKFLQLGLVDETDEYYNEGAHRPARLYTFKQHQLQTLSRSFD